MKTLFQVVKKTITKQALIDIVSGAVGDVLSGEYPGNTKMHMVYDVADLNNIGGFYLVEDIVKDMCAVTVGRMIRFISGEVYAFHGISYATRR